MKNRIIKYRWFMPVFLSIYAICIQSQNTQSLNFKEIIPNSTVISIVQDSIGFMWLGTNEGIYRFDGYSTLSFISQQIGNLYINFLKHKTGHLYIGSNNGFFDYDYINNKSKLCSEFLRDKDIIAYHSFDNYEVVATSKDVFFFDHSWKFLNRIVVHKKSPVDNHIICMAIDNNRNIWLGTESGLFIIRTEDNNKAHIQNLYKGRRIPRIHFDTHGHVWICQGEEILYGDQKTAITNGLHKLKHISYNTEVESIFEHADQIWVGTRGAGVFIYEYNEKEQVTLTRHLLMDETEDSDLKNTIFDIYKDIQANIWICTPNGLYLCDKNENPNFYTIKYSKNQQNSLSSNVLSSIFCDKHNNLWLATSKGINKVKWENEKEYKITQYTDSRDINNIMANNKIQCITEFKDDIFLVSTKSKIKFFDAKKNIFYDDKSLSDTLDTYGMRFVRSTFKDNYNNIWFAFLEGVGAINTKTGKFSRLNIPENIITKQRAICRDMNGNIWVSSDDDGLYCLQLTNDLQVVKPKLYSKELFGGSWITTLFIDKRHRMWIGTSNGLYKYNKEQDIFEKLEFPYSRKSTYIGGIIQDNMENIWAVGLRGIYKINLENIIYYYELNTNQDIVMTWYNLGLCHNLSGEIFIGGVNGLNFFNPTMLVSDTHPHHISISDVEILNKKASSNYNNITQDINISGKLTLSYKDQQFSLSFSSLYYKEPMKIEYAYMLEGFDKEWIITDASRHYASYSNLKSGNYTFKVKSTNASGIWLDNIKTIQIIVKPAPWKTWWAYILYFIAILSIIFLIMRIFNLGAKLKRKDAMSKWKMNYYTNLSYGFKVPLTLIYAPLQYLLKNYTQLAEPEVKRMLYTMSQSVSKLSDQVSHLIKFKEISIDETDLQLSCVDAFPILQGVYNLFVEEMSEKQIVYSFESNIQSVNIYIDITKIEVALYNILEDAISYIFENGKIEMKCTVNSQNYNLSIDIIAKQSEKKMIKEEDLNTRFSIAYDYLKLHHCELAVKNMDKCKIRKYSFTLSLGNSHYTPKELKSLNNSKSVSLLPLTRSSANETIENNKLKLGSLLPVICLYEGDKEIDNFIKNIFIKQYDVQLITSSKNIKLLIEKKPILIIFDVIKEDDYKFDLCCAIKENYILSPIPIIFISSLHTNTIERKAYEAGADVFITKPFDISVLEAHIRQLLNIRAIIKDHVRKELIVNPKEVLITSDDDKFLVGVIKVIEENMANIEFNIDHLASALNISRSTLYRRILDITDMTSIDLIRNIRMKRAANLLEATSRSVADISLEVGYSDQRYFSLNFKKEFGKTPKQYAISQKQLNK